MKQATTVTVLIATYGRPDSLRRCLTALSAQLLLPDEVLIVVRDEDVVTHRMLESAANPKLRIRVVPVSVPGVVQARNAALDVCSTDVVSIIDDDTAPYENWLYRIMQAFQSDSELGGLGGRDRCFANGAFDDRQERRVGQIAWYGKVFGNHHLGFGEIRVVDVLKGANMSFRMEAVGPTRFDLRLRGSGAQPAEDLCFSVAVKRKGWKISYDPGVMLEHYTAERSEPRLYVGVQPVADQEAYSNFCYNQVIAVWGALSPIRRIAFFVWSTIIGTDVFPGLLQAARFTSKLGFDSWNRFYICQRMKSKAFWELSKSATDHDFGT
jgi:glycosyltransferase involved in cell wall biosynthesis